MKNTPNIPVSALRGLVDGPATVPQLAAAMDVTDSAAGAAVAILIRQQLVAQVDETGTLQITPAGLALVTATHEEP